MSVKAPVTPGLRPFSSTDRLSALVQMTGDPETAETLHQTLPAWLIGATPEHISAYAADMAQLQTRQLKVQPALDALKSLHEFCRSELSEALTKAYNVGFDVEQDSVELPALDCGCEESTSPGAATQPAAPAKRSLLEAAMHNFTEDETKDDGLPAGGIVRLVSTPAGLSRLTPTAFAKTCRDVDLGQRYQDHFEKTLESAALKTDIQQLKKSALNVDARAAYLKGHISEAALQMLQSLTLGSGTGSQSGATPILYEQAPMHLQGLEFFGTCIWGVVIFSRRSLKDHPTQSCIVYMPNEPARRVYEYKALLELQVYLHQQLKVSTYRDFFTGYIDEASKIQFCASIINHQD